MTEEGYDDVVQLENNSKIKMKVLRTGALLRLVVEKIDNPSHRVTNQRRREGIFLCFHGSLDAVVEFSLSRVLSASEQVLNK